MNYRIRSGAGVAALAAASLVALAACSGSSSDGTSASTAASAAAPASSAAAATEAAPSAAASEAPAPSAAAGGASDADKLTADQCGTEAIKIAHIDGFGGNTWRKTVRGELADELSVCPNITVDYTDAGGDLQKYISAVNSATAQGYNIVLTFDDFGSQALSALKNAKKAGAVVATYVADAQGKLGEDYDVFVPYGFPDEGHYMAEWLAKQVKPGANNLIFTGGLEGGSVPTVALMDAMKEKNKELGDPLNFLTDKPIPSGWDPATMQKAMAGVLAKYPDINAYASDYGVADLGALRAFMASGRDIPPWATSATDNELGCMWLDNHAKYPNWQLLAMDGTTSTVRTTIRKAMSKLNGFPDTYPEMQPLIPFIDTLAGKDPVCRKDLPPDADLSANLTEEQLKAVFGN